MPSLACGFNSRTLGRVRLIPAVNDWLVVRVSIHAPWEGCDSSCDPQRQSYPVSIHAPWEGCDFDNQFLRGFFLQFQFTHPGKGATPHTSTDIIRQVVSIHAPWEGCDQALYRAGVREGRFNSRTLGRVRRECRCRPCLRSCRFNSRTLGRVRPVAFCYQKLRKEFQFTHPGKGATPNSGSGKAGEDSFNSRTLGRVRLLSSSNS